MISVILLTYNGEKYIEKCINSIISQSIGIENIQIVIIDDISTDNTLNILNNYQSRFSDNILIIKSKTRSVYENFSNKDLAIQYCKGDYILFIDQDDWFEPDSFKKVIDYMLKFPELEYIECNFQYIDEEDGTKAIAKVKEKGFNQYIIDSEEQRMIYSIDNILPGSTYVWNKIYKKEFLVNNKIYHADGIQKSKFGDNLFSGLLAMHCKNIGKLDILLYNYRKHIGSLSRDLKKNSKIQFERCKAGIYFYNECEARGLLDKNPQMVEYIFFRTFLLKTFWKFLLQYNPIPYEYLFYIQKEIYTKFPDYRKNSIMCSRPEMNILFDVLDVEWSKLFLDDLQSTMNKKIKDTDISKYLYLI